MQGSTTGGVGSAPANRSHACLCCLVLFVVMCVQVVEVLRSGDVRTLQGFVDTFVDKAVRETHFSAMYAQWVQDVRRHKDCPQVSSEAHTRMQHAKAEHLYAPVCPDLPTTHLAWMTLRVVCVCVCVYSSHPSSSVTSLLTCAACCCPSARIASHSH